ncbi:MAG TPA: hypothetical protein VGQ57_18610 [Polyangiaceae bacterium]|nr:hypothetical protein [Polyangiaceae bacterium]
MLAVLRGLVTACVTLAACSSPRPSTAPREPPDAATVSVELGTPGGDDGLTFVPFESGQVLNLETFGQGGTHVLLGARTRGFGIRAFAAFSLEDLDTGNTLLAPAPTRPQLFYCHDDVCDLLPVTMMAGGLTRTDEEREGLPIAVHVEVQDDEDPTVTAAATQDAVLSTKDLNLGGAPTRAPGEAGSTAGGAGGAGP